MRQLLVQLRHAVEQCFPVGRREQLQAFLVACIRLAERRIVAQSFGQEQPRAAVELAHGVRRHRVDKPALHPLVTDTAGIGRCLDLLGESVRAADTRQQIGELAFGEMCQLIEPDDSYSALWYLVTSLSASQYPNSSAEPFAKSHRCSAHAYTLPGHCWISRKAAGTSERSSSGMVRRSMSCREPG